jgi:hypothetical protein
MIISMPSNNIDWPKYAAIIISGLALLYTYCKDRKMNKRMAKVEEEQKLEKQEAALRRSRASAPYFTPSTALYNNLFELGDDGQFHSWGAGSKNLLTVRRKEIAKDASKDTPVIFVIDNLGKDAKRIKISGDIPGFEMKREPRISAAGDYLFVKYPYDPAQQGKTQKVIFSFETEDGDNISHIYETRHGFHEFKRIDPA